MENLQDVKTLSDKLICYLRAKLGNPALGLASPLARLQGGYETASYRFALDGASGELSRSTVTYNSFHVETVAADAPLGSNDTLLAAFAVIVS